MEAPAAALSRVLTIGTFDLLHYGHLIFLRRCARLGQELIVGVNSDDFAAGFKARPVLNSAERQNALEFAGYRTRVNFSAGRELIEEVRPSVLAVGSDWARRDYLSQVDVGQDELERWGLTLAYVPYTPGISTSEIRRRIAAAG